MKNFITSLGRRVSAETPAAAAEIARQYGLGEIVGPAPKAPKPAKAPKPTAPGKNWIVWDDLVQAVEFRGTEEECREWAETNDEFGGQPVVMRATRYLK